MLSTSSRAFALVAAVSLAVLVQAPAVSGQTAPRDRSAAGRLSGGNGTLYIGGYPNLIWIVDEATENITGTIELKVGIPRRANLSRDRKRFYIVSAEQERIEVVDIATRQSIDTFTLSEGNRKVRINAVEADPSHRYLILLTRAATKLRDRWEIGPSTLLQYDMAEHKVVRTIPWPDGVERDSANLMFSTDGKLLYLLGTEVLIFETDTYKQVDKWQLSNAEEGLGQVSASFGGFAGLDTVYDRPGYLTTMLTVEDPVQRRRLVGVGTINLAAKSIDFYTIGPSNGVSFALSPDRKRAYGLRSEIGEYEFSTIDLEQRRIMSRADIPGGRPRMALKVSTNGRLLYIWQAGNTIDVYEAATYRYLRTITFDGDATTVLYVVPPASFKP
jgi:hypothetical protein